MAAFRRPSLYVIPLLLIVGLVIGGGLYWRNQTIDKACTNDCNILLISVDSLRADHMSAFGYKRNTTPNFDKLAKQSTLFLNYYTPSYLTPVSEMTVQTGMYPNANGIKNFYDILPSTNLTLAEYLKQAGYSTQAIISSPEFLNYPDLQQSFSRSFDKYQPYAPPNENSLTKLGRGFPAISNVNQALSAGKNGKSFLWLTFGEVHWPYGLYAKNVYADPNYNGQFKNSILQWNVLKNIYNDVVYPAKKPLDKADSQFIIDQYDNGIKAFDDYIGQVMSSLKQQHLDKKTLVIIESEHGEGMGENGYFSHYDILETQTHTPLLIIDPRVHGGKRINSLTGSVDVLPTILQSIGKAIPSTIQGRSLVPLLNGQEPDGQRKVIYQERTPLWEEALLNVKNDYATAHFNVSVAPNDHDEDIGIRTDKWAYIQRLSSKKLQQISWWQFVSGQTLSFPDAELFDLTKDKLETKNVIAEHPEVAAQLKQQLSLWFIGISKNAPSNQNNTSEVQPYF